MCQLFGCHGQHHQHLLPPPPALVNYQAWLAAEGLQYHFGIHPSPGNLSDNPKAAWNDAITAIDSSSSTESGSSIALPLVPAQATEQNRSLDINIALTSAGLHINMSTQGNMVSSLLLNEFVPVL